MSKCKDSHIIIDIGACTGVFSILSSKINPTSNIFAFEPYFFNFERMKRNISINQCNNIKIFDYAIGKSNTILPLTIPVNARVIDTSSFNSSHSRSIYPELDWKSIDVQQISLDFFADNFLHGQKIDIVKIDVEDHELEVLEGMQQIILVYKPDIFFESFLTLEKIRFLNELSRKHGYYSYAIMEDSLVFIDNFTQTKGINFLLSKDKNPERAL